MISKDRVYTQLEASGKLPVLPEVLLTLLAACDDPESSISDIADIISRDPSLSLRVLQLVNSAYYGFRHSFSGIEQAVVYLGANTVKNLAITTSVHQVFAQQATAGMSLLDSAFFWHHSLMTATLARRLALEIGGCCSEEAYLAGLLHDIGKLLLSSSFPEVSAADVPGMASDEQRLRHETQTMGLNHCDAGSWLVRKWNLGSLIADAIEYHHENIDQVGEAFPLVKVVYLANILAIRGRSADEIERLWQKLFADEPGDLAAWLGSAEEEVGQVAVSMGIAVGQAARPSLAAGGDAAGESVKHRMGRKSQASIAARVRNMSLLAMFQEELMQAGTIDAILAAQEKAMAMLFDIAGILCFLPDDNEVLLQAKVSGNSILHSATQGLTFAMRQNGSLVVTAFRQRREPGIIIRDRQGASIADQQLLSVLNCERAMPVPLVVDNTGVGVAVIGLPADWQQMSEDDHRLLGIIIQQVALRLYLEREKRRKEELLHRERMTAIATTARKFAHEINNPLGIIGNYLVTLRLKLGAEPEVLRDLAIIDEEIQRISSMVSQMEMYSQAPFSRFEPIDLNTVVRDIIQIAKPSFFNGGGPTVSFIPGTDLPRLTTVKDAVKQVLINLLKNAAEAMSAGGRVIVRTRKSQPEGLGGSGGVELIVSDSGPGLPEEVMQNLYKPFVTTKQNGHSGLGLSIVHKVVADIGGKLSCLSSPAEGTTFTIYFPGTLPDGLQQ